MWLWIFKCCWPVSFFRFACFNPWFDCPPPSNPTYLGCCLLPIPIPLAHSLPKQSSGARKWKRKKYRKMWEQPELVTSWLKGVQLRTGGQVKFKHASSVTLLGKMHWMASFIALYLFHFCAMNDANVFVTCIHKLSSFGNAQVALWLHIGNLFFSLVHTWVKVWMSNFYDKCQD